MNHKRIKDRFPILLVDGPLKSREEWNKYMRTRRRLLQVPIAVKEDCAIQIAKQLKRLEKHLENNGHSR